MIIRFLVCVFGGIWKLKERCEQTKFSPIRKLFIWLYGGYQSSYGASIAWNSYFLGVPGLPHGLHGIFISGDARIGSDCVIFQQVTIGSNSLLDSKRIGAPTIGNNCYIGVGAKIIGNVTIGDNVRIAANCVVYEDVSPNSVVVSGRQKTIKRQGRLNNRLYSYKDGWRYFRDGQMVAETSPEIIDRLNDAFEK